jgi:predicted aldo/keto reductase-like oxidoreductase
MQYREDKRSGNQLSALGYGCMRLPSQVGKIQMDQTEKLLMEAIRNGVNYFDTAYIYGGSEAALGQVFEKNHVREKIFLATKLPLFLCRKYADFDKLFRTQLERLKTDYIDYYFMHMLTSPAQWEQLCKLGIEKWIAEKKASGQIRQVGFSFHGMQNDFISLVDAYDWDFCQIQFNYINIHYQAGLTGLKYASGKGLPVFIMEPLLGGRLANALPPKAEEIFHKADASSTPASWALRWVWNHPEVTVVLSGMNRMVQLTENITIADTALPGSLSEQDQQTVQEVIRVFNESYKVPCTGCGYCMPCPQNVNIPACFAAYNTSYAMNKAAGMQQYITSVGLVTKKPSMAGRCIRCGKCEKHCPQNIPIRDSLELVKKRMEPSWFRIAASAAKLFVR